MDKKGKSRKKEALYGILFVAPAAVGTLIFFLFPFLISVFYSFMDGVATRRFVGLQNYMELLGNKTFQMAVGNTVRFVVVAIPFLNLVALTLAFLLMRMQRTTRDFLRSTYIFPLVLPVASVVLFFEFLFHETGIVNIALQFFHMDAIDFMHSQYAFWVLIILYVWKNCGYNVILFVAMLESVPKEYYEEASLQGAGSLAKMWYITLPVSVPYLFFILIISFVNSFKAFREAYVLFGNYPDNSIYMIQHFINNNFENINYTRISTSAALVFSVIFLIVLFLFWLQKIWNERN